MLAKLLLLFTIVPIIELALLIPLGRWMGWGPTIGLIVITGIVGAVLGKREGLRAWRRVQDDLANARIPGDSLLDGLAVLIAGAFLVTPGVLTDIAGMVLLLPLLRRPLRRWFKRRVTKLVTSPSITIKHFSSFQGASGFDSHDTTANHPDDVIDITPDSIER